MVYALFQLRNGTPSTSNGELIDLFESQESAKRSADEREPGMTWYTSRLRPGETYALPDIRSGTNTNEWIVKEWEVKA